MIRSDKYDLIVLDIKLPRMSGIELYEFMQIIISDWGKVNDILAKIENLKVRRSGEHYGHEKAERVSSGPKIGRLTGRGGRMDNTIRRDEQDSRYC